MRRLPWWRNTSPEENDTLLELSQLKQRQIQREEERQKAVEKTRTGGIRQRKQTKKDGNDD